jgi:hypothetical protein
MISNFSELILCTYIGEERGVFSVWWENLRERGHLGDPGEDWRIILR